jgi:uncharacterized protein (TIGR04255 family)
MFDLPDPSPFRLRNAPLAQVLAQVRYPVVAHLETLPGLAPLQDRLRSSYPYLQHNQIPEVAFLVGPSGAAASPATTRAQADFTNGNDRHLVIEAGSATLSVGPSYPGVETFRTWFEEILVALRDVEQVDRCERLGVRYLDVVELPPGGGASWAAWFQPEIVGWVGNGVLASTTSVVTSIAQTQLAAPAIGDLADAPVDAQAIIRHGLVPAGVTLPGIPPVVVSQPSFILDIDLFFQAPQHFAVDALVNQFSILHRQIERFFAWMITDEGAAYFQREPLT